MLPDTRRLCLIAVLIAAFAALSAAAASRPSGATAGPDPPALPARHRAGVAVDLLREPDGSARRRRKGRPARWALAARACPAKKSNRAQTVQLCDIEGPGTIRHLWLTTKHHPAALRGLVIRAWWEGQEHPEHRMPRGRFLRHGPRQGHALLLRRAFGRAPGRNEPLAAHALLQAGQIRL